MEKQDLKSILKSVESGSLSAEDAYKKLGSLSFTDLGYAKVDHHRAVRQGVGEVIFGQGKTPQQIIGIISSMEKEGQKNILITRLDEKKAEVVMADLSMDYDSTSRIGIIGKNANPVDDDIILVATGGTSDIPVAEEAARTAEFLGNRVQRLYDVGVAGIHRLLSHEEDIKNASVIIAIAGMEGALASVIGGMASVPVIAVPTSVGYGASFDGLCALLAMLNSCASGVGVVNIDNGFGAGLLAHKILEGKRNVQVDI